MNRIKNEFVSFEMYDIYCLPLMIITLQSCTEISTKKTTTTDYSTTSYLMCINWFLKTKKTLNVGYDY